MRRRDYLLTSVALTLPLAGCSGSTEDDGGGDTVGGDNPSAADETQGEAPEDSGTPTSTNTPEDGSEAASEPDPITFEGSGQTVTDEFDLVGGFVIAVMEHVGGESNFQVELVDEESGDMAGLFANVIGEWSGEVGETINQGTYVLDINADGDWSVELRQPRPTQGDAPPIEESGTTSIVIGPYELEGRMEATGRHNADGNFIVRGLDAEATGRAFGELVFNEIGEFEGTTSFAGDGLSWITVQAGGEWELSIE